MEGHLAKNTLEEFVCSANDAIEFKLVRSQKDINDDSIVFRPTYTHQLFGDSENIFGYKQLRIQMYYTARRLKLYFSIDFSEKIDPKVAGGVEADDISRIITEKLELNGQTHNLDEFSKWLETEDTFKPFGTKLHSFTAQSINYKRNGKENGTAADSDRHFEIYYTNSQTPNFVEKMHEQMQHFLLWFIDGASYIDAENERWDYFTIYEKIKTPDHAEQHFFVGYATVHKCYAYPNNIRPRICQVLILPPFQRRNIGVHLLQTIYNYYIALPEVIDITVEDPSENFSQLRNYVDCLYLSKLPSFSSDNLVNSKWNKEMEKEARTKCRINPRQARKVYEILKLRAINVHDAKQYRNYRIEVKRRLSAPLMKNRKATAFFGGKLNEDQTPRELVIEELSLVFAELEKEYKSTISRLNSAGF